MPRHAQNEQLLRLVPSGQDRELRLDIEAFLVDCEVRNLAPKTLKTYRYQFETFLRWFGPRSEPVSAQDVRLYLLALRSKVSPSTQHQAFRVLRTFFRWLVVEGLLDESPMARLKPPRLPDNPLDPVPLPEVKAMLDTCKRRRQLDHRDAALLLALLDTAARASEMLGCDVNDADLRSGALVLRQTKGGKQRVTFLGSRARRALLRYLRDRGDLAGDAPLFATRDGRRLSYWGLRQMLRRRAEKAGVPAPGAHAFRRAACLAMLRNGADVFAVQALAGHADLATTRRYLKLAQDDLAEAHRQHSPVDNLLNRG